MTAGTQYQNVAIIKGGQFMVPEDAPPSDTPQAERALLDRPELRSAWFPQPRAATEAEAAEYARRETDPAWAWLRDLVADGNALREAQSAAHAEAVASILSGAPAAAPEPAPPALARPYIAAASPPVPDPGGEVVPEETAPDQTAAMEPVTQLVPRVDTDGAA